MVIAPNTELAITVSYPTSANGIIVLLNSLISKNLKYEIQAKKATKSEQNRKNLMKMRCGQTDIIFAFCYPIRI